MADVFDPIMIGTMEVKNRIVAAPMVSNSATEDGNVTPKMVAYYAEKARGGFGLVHVEASYIRPDGKGDFARMHGAYDDRQITGLSELAAAIKENGAKSCIQLLHSGREASPRMTKTQPIAPSAVPWAGVMPKVMTPEDIEEMIQCYVEACLRCQAAGFDAVMLHGAHGFLIGEFASPYTNRREDEYGQDRYLFAKQLVRRVKEACGEDYPVLMRISGDEHLGDQGLTIDEVADSYTRRPWKRQGWMLWTSRQGSSKREPISSSPATGPGRSSCRWRRK